MHPTLLQALLGATKPTHMQQTIIVGSADFTGITRAPHI
jgi:hypothetical protein